ncbi:MAG: tetratricopeptide repeat protein [Planctomycetota bacterium]
MTEEDGKNSKKWWIVGVAVPILAAIIALVPGLISGGKGGDRYNNVGIVGDPTFNNLNLVIEQARKAGHQLSDEMLGLLDKAMALVKSKDYTKAIPILKEVAVAAPVPALLNNVGAAYLATKDWEQARPFLERALVGSESNSPARTNFELFAGPVRWGTVEGLQAELIRFEDTGGLTTLEVRLLNVGKDSINLKYIGRTSGYLIAENVPDKKWEPELSGGAEKTGHHHVKSGESYVFWLKFRIEEELRDGTFTAVVPWVASPFEQLRIGMLKRKR